ncbi:structural protein, partial [Flavobacterium phage vB_FspP_elemoA_11-9B]
SVGDFILSAKPSSIETSGIRGYYMNTRFNLQTTGYAEVYAINSEALHSFE